MTFNQGYKTRTPGDLVAEIRRLRLRDGLPTRAVADMLGMSAGNVRNYAPGRPGKVPVAPLRAAFDASPVTASDVARHLEWWDGRSKADSSRVKRTLGINRDSSHGYRSRRTLIDAETAMLIAEAIGISPWSILPDENEEM
jgi:hypothetical protein